MIWFVLVVDFYGSTAVAIVDSANDEVAVDSRRVRLIAVCFILHLLMPMLFTRYIHYRLLGCLFCDLQ
jgi:hypothetical protein